MKINVKDYYKMYNLNRKQLFGLIYDIAFDTDNSEVDNVLRDCLDELCRLYIEDKTSYDE